jgi:hypothetical protein
MILALGTLSFLFACERQADWEYQEAPEILVVDALLTNELKIQEIKLSFLKDSMSQKSKLVSGASVKVFENDEAFTFFEISPGYYKYLPKRFALINKNYRLRIEYQGKVYFARCKAVPVEAINENEYAIEENESGWFEINQIADSYSFNTPSMHELYLDWSSTGLRDEKGKNSAKLIYYALPSLDIHQLFAPDKEKISFPEGTKITHKKYSLTEEHAQFIRSLLTETEWKGGLFDPPSANIPTNLSEGAIGYFGSCSVVIKEFVFTK